MLSKVTTKANSAMEATITTSVARAASMLPSFGQRALRPPAASGRPAGDPPSSGATPPGRGRRGPADEWRRGTTRRTESRLVHPGVDAPAFGRRPRAAVDRASIVHIYSAQEESNLIKLLSAAQKS